MSADLLTEIRDRLVRVEDRMEDVRDRVIRVEGKQDALVVRQTAHEEKTAENAALIAGLGLKLKPIETHVKTVQLVASWGAKLAGFALAVATAWLTYLGVKK